MDFECTPSADEMLKIFAREGIRENKLEGLPKLLLRYRAAVVDEMTRLGVPSHCVEAVIDRSGFDSLLSDPEVVDDMITTEPTRMAWRLIVVAACR